MSCESNLTTYIREHHHSIMSNSSRFGEFYEWWYEELHRLLQELSWTRRPPQTAEEKEKLVSVMEKVMWHYEEYYRRKTAATEADPLQVLVSPWASTLERSLHWIGGWRPTTAFHLVYTESSLLFESHIIDILRGLRTGDLGDLSPSQFRRVSHLQCDTVRM